MTHEQRNFLVANPPYEPIGRTAGGINWIHREVLLPNGSLGSNPSDAELLAVERPPLWEGAPFEPIEIGIRQLVGR